MPSVKSDQSNGFLEDVSNQSKGDLEDVTVRSKGDFEDVCDQSKGDLEDVYEDELDHFNYEQDKLTSHGGKNRSKKETEMNTNRHNPGGHERKIVTKLMNAEKKQSKTNCGT